MDLRSGIEGRIHLTNLCIDLQKKLEQIPQSKSVAKLGAHNLYNSTSEDKLICPMRIRSQLFISMRIRIRSGSRKPNQCGYMRILVRFVTVFSQKKLNFYMKNILKVGNRSKTYIQRCKSLSETRFICKFLSISMLLDPDPHSQYGSGSKTAK